MNGTGSPVTNSGDVEIAVKRVANSEKIICGDSFEVLKTLESGSVDCVITSPPYDGLRDYNGFTFNFEGIARQLVRVLKDGGVIVWIVNDQCQNGSESGTSFRQALFFKEIGLNLHDTMIWEKDSFSFPEDRRYRSVFEYMFVFSKGTPKTANLIADRKNKYAGSRVHGTSRGVDGETFRKSNDNKNNVLDFGVRFNVWHLSGEKDNKYGHPAPFPSKIAQDHILSWSNEGDLILDPFVGSGTTVVNAKYLNRRSIGIDISPDYCAIAERRLLQAKLF